MGRRSSMTATTSSILRLSTSEDGVSSSSTIFALYEIKFILYVLWPNIIVRPRLCIFIIITYVFGTDPRSYPIPDCWDWRVNGNNSFSTLFIFNASFDGNRKNLNALLRQYASSSHNFSALKEATKNSSSLEKIILHELVPWHHPSSKSRILGWFRSIW